MSELCTADASTGLRAATNCISEVLGVAKQTLTAARTRWLVLLALHPPNAVSV
jgi:hypothetical protein